MGHANLIKVINSFTLAGLIVNISGFIIMWNKSGGIPTSSLQNVFQILIISIIVIYLILYLKFKRSMLAFFILPIAIIIGVLTFALKGATVQTGFTNSFWLYLHLPLTIIGSALFMISAITGLMYVMQERQLKNKTFGKIFHRFPPLNVLNQLNDTTLITGFAFFTSGLIAGIIWALVEYSGIFTFTPKLIFGFITWTIFGIILLIKHTKGLSPNNTAIWSIVGFISIIITYFAVALFLLR
jgi:ABC-type uncharacterized transport system permease subunit